MLLSTQTQLRFITSSEIRPLTEELLPYQKIIIQNISPGFDYTNSKSIPISFQASKTQKSNKHHPKKTEKKLWFLPPASTISLLHPPFFKSPLRYFLHPSKAAVIINESLPVLSALCMRALCLKAEGNGGWTEGEGQRVTHACTHIHAHTPPHRVTDLHPRSQKY